jgi:hypothetical protein
MAAVGQAARLAPRVRRGAVERRGAIWIAVIAALLAGVVALNVAVLRLNVPRKLSSSRVSPASWRRAGWRIAPATSSDSSRSI